MLAEIKNEILTQIKAQAQMQNKEFQIKFLTYTQAQIPLYRKDLLAIKFEEYQFMLKEIVREALQYNCTIKLVPFDYEKFIAWSKGEDNEALRAHWCGLQ